MSEDHGKVVWSELVTSDPERSKAFWGRVAGWTFEAMPMGDGSTYTIMLSGGAQRGGMMPRHPEMGDGPDFWQNYIAVDDVDAAAGAVAGAGGRVITPPFDVDGVGRVAIIADATGVVAGLMKPALPG